MLCQYGMIRDAEISFDLDRDRKTNDLEKGLSQRAQRARRNGGGERVSQKENLGDLGVLARAYSEERYDRGSRFAQGLRQDRCTRMGTN